MSKRRTVALALTAVLLGALSITPVGAHVGESVGHLWRQHLLPMATNTFFTKRQTYSRAQANSRFYNTDETVASASTIEGNRIAFARVAADGTLDSTRSSSHVTGVRKANVGVYCVDLDFVPKSATASIDGETTSSDFHTRELAVLVDQEGPQFATVCNTPADPDMTVQVGFRDTAGGLIDTPFQIIIMG